ncbi:MAG: OmpA family protein [Bacteroidota bacterium]
MRSFAFACLLFFIATTSIIAQSESDKPTPEDFVTSGYTKLTGNNCFQLTPDRNWTSGSVWHKKAIDLNAPFEMEVDLMLGCKDADGADGIVFVFHPNFNKMGFMGEGMGFAGLRPSLGIEIDTWQNHHLEDPSFDHLALLQNGSMNHFYSLTPPEKIPNIEDCRTHTMKVKWLPSITTFTIFIDDRLYLNYKGDIVNRIFRGNAKVYWGVTAATGGFNNKHALCFEKLVYDEVTEEEMVSFSPIKSIDLLKGEIRTLDQLQFTSGSAGVKKESFGELEKLYRLLKENPAYSLEIFGHTDSSGDAERNKVLSQNRAEAVAQYLIARGIDKKRIKPIGYGELYPLTSNRTPEGRSLNRRVEIHLFKPIP